MTTNHPKRITTPEGLAQLMEEEIQTDPTLAATREDACDVCGISKLTHPWHPTAALCPRRFPRQSTMDQGAQS